MRLLLRAAPVALVIAALLACKQGEEQKPLPEPPAATSTAAATEPSAAPAPEAEPTPAKAGSPTTPSTPTKPVDAGTDAASASDASTAADAAPADAGSTPTATDAGTAPTTAVDAGGAATDFQARVQQCMNACSSAYDTCKAADPTKLGDCVMKNAGCLEKCK